jgi:hypothetical protein
VAGISAHGTQVLLGVYPIKNCKDITLPSPTTEDVDITTLDDIAQVFIDGTTDYGEVGFDINYDPSEYTHVTLRELSQSKLSQTWTVTMVDSGAEAWTFSGWVKTFSISAPVSGVYTATVSIKVTGLPVVS